MQTLVWTVESVQGHVLTHALKNWQTVGEIAPFYIVVCVFQVLPTLTALSIVFVLVGRRWFVFIFP